MNPLEILISGDYWHEDFREPFSRLEVPATMVPTQQIQSVFGRQFHLIVLAQSRRDQISQSTIDFLRSELFEVPIVLLLGSWCEGENRSGKPLQGVNQVLWHQWDSRFERFCIQMKEGLKSDWHQPLTASVSDRVRDFAPDSAISEMLQGKKVLISSEDNTTFESISDMLSIYQCAGFWAESRESGAADVDAICVDGNGASEELIDRIVNLKAKFENVPVSVMLNFPRQQDLDSLMAVGVKEVVSKPYTHNEFLHSLTRSMAGNVEAQRHGIPKPSITGKRLTPKS